MQPSTSGLLFQLFLLIVVMIQVYRIKKIKKQVALVTHMLNDQLRMTDEYAWNVESSRFDLSTKLHQLESDYACSVAKNSELGVKIANTNLTLIAQDQAIENYQYINAHQLRAPVARIIGLTTLLSPEYQNNDERDIVFRLQKEATELDRIVHEIQKSLCTAEIQMKNNFQST